jgi:hypothetical protein
MSGRAFISHSEKDKSLAQLLLGALENRGIRCWIAPRDIPPGGSYADALMRAIEECSCFLLVYSAHSNTSGHVLREVERALKFDRNIIPIRFDQSEPSRSLDYLLATVQWLSVDIGAGRDSVDNVAEQIVRCLPTARQSLPKDSTSVTDRQSAIPAEFERRSRRPVIIVGTLLALILCGAALVVKQLSTQHVVNAGTENTGIVSPSQPQTIRTEQKTPAAQIPATQDTSLLEIQKFLASRQIAPTPQQQPLHDVAPAQQGVAPSAPAESAPQPSSSDKPQDTLRRYYACFRERDAYTAYALLSIRFRSNLSFKKYNELFSSTRDMTLLESNLVKQDANTARIDISVRETDAAFHNAVWQGPIELVWDSGGWHINSMKELKRVSAPSSR